MLLMIGIRFIRDGGSLFPVKSNVTEDVWLMVQTYFR